MLIAVEDLRLRPVSFERDYGVGEIGVEDTDLDQVGPLHVEGSARLVGKDAIRLQMRLKGRVCPVCARCLQVIESRVDETLDLLYEPESELEAAQEVEIHTADTEVGFYTGAGLELEDVMREQVLLALPMRPLCRPDCRGLCPQCGRNLNEGPCQCAPQRDPRWSGLQALREPKTERDAESDSADKSQ